MNMPTMDSTPGSSAGLPDTVLPNTTSSVPDQRDSSNAHAPCTTVFTVSPARCAAARRPAVAAGPRSVRIAALDSVRWAWVGGRS
jgi:hypothetical protein